jgi:hypothetical protein
LIAIKTSPRYKLLGSDGESAYTTKHKAAPAHNSKANGGVNYFINFIGHGTPFFYVKRFGPSSISLRSASSEVKPTF